jgi:hypothetical protein
MNLNCYSHINNTNPQTHYRTTVPVVGSGRCCKIDGHWNRPAALLLLLLSCRATCAALQQHSQSLLAGLPPPTILQQLLQAEMDGTRDSTSPILLPCCYDGLTARLIARYHHQHHQHPIQSSLPTQESGASQGPTNNLRFEATFLSGFGTSAVYGIPDTQLISYQEMLHTCSIVSEALCNVALEQQKTYPIPCIAVRSVVR